MGMELFSLVVMGNEEQVLSVYQYISVYIDFCIARPIRFVVGLALNTCYYYDDDDDQCLREGIAFDF